MKCLRLFCAPRMKWPFLCSCVKYLSRYLDRLFIHKAYFINCCCGLDIALCSFFETPSLLLATMPQSRSATASATAQSVLIRCATVTGACEALAGAVRAAAFPGLAAARGRRPGRHRDTVQPRSPADLPRDPPLSHRQTKCPTVLCLFTSRVNDMSASGFTSARQPYQKASPSPLVLQCGIKVQQGLKQDT